VLSVNSKLTAALIIPTLNAAKEWPALLAGIQSQTFSLRRVLIVDSSSTDGTDKLAAEAGFDVVSITRAEFNHGRTRQMAADMNPDVDLLIYMTHDAQLVGGDSIALLLEPFTDPTMGAVYGRQLPRPDAGPLEAHARHFNYPEKSSVKGWEDRQTYGIRATFLSNSFSAYRRSALVAVGGFPENTIVAEDALTAGKMLMAGWKTAYVAEATVSHSHPYSIAEEFRRYFDTGVYHHREAWLLEQFGSASGEGKRFVLSELKSLWPRHLYLVPAAMLRTLAKLVGYHLGRREAKLPPTLRRRLSMHKRYWDSV
jgi:rhamnosyltransferase